MPGARTPHRPVASAGGADVVMGQRCFPDHSLPFPYFSFSEHFFAQRILMICPTLVKDRPHRNCPFPRPPAETLRTKKAAASRAGETAAIDPGP